MKLGVTSEMVDQLEVQQNRRETETETERGAGG